MAPDDRAVENVGRSSSSSSNSHPNSPQHQRQQEPRTQSQHTGTIDDNNSNHQMSVAAMSTTTATTGDDVSSMGGETETNYSMNHSRRKRKDDCSESRCTVTSEESARSRSRRRRHRLQTSSCHRWLERIDRTAATSHAPIRPSRSDDDVFSPTATTGWMTQQPQQQQQQRTFSSSLSRIGASTGQSLLPTSGTAPGMSSLNQSSRGGRSYSDADVNAREVARSQSMSLPPIRPTRLTSQTDLLASDDDSDEEEHKTSKKNATYDVKNNEIDPQMYARLLHGCTSAMDPPPSLAGRRAAGATSSTTTYASKSAPPKMPRRCSDADALPAYLFNALEKQRVPQAPALTRFNTIAVTTQRVPDLTSTSVLERTATTGTGNGNGSDKYVCPQECQTMRGGNCHHAISPKPPAKPLRSVDDRRSGRGRHAEMPVMRTGTDLDEPLLHNHNVHRVSDLTAGLEKDATASRRETGSGLPQDHHHHQNETSASSGMDLEEDEEEDMKPRADEGGNPNPHEVEKDEELSEHEEDEDETEVSARTSEYDADLFARLLSGEACDTKDAKRSTGQLTTEALSAKNSEEHQPPATRAARVVSNGTTTTPHPGYNRFDNSAPCTVPEHMAGAVKSSHPPMRPRRSIDESCFKYNDTLAAAVAAAYVADAVENGITGMPDPEMPPPIRLIGNKRRASRRLSRRLTMPLASEMPSSDENVDGQTCRDEVEPLDSTREANLVAFSKPLDESHGDSSGTADGRDDDYERHYEESEASCTAADGSYSRILPARRRVMRRFTMPSKGRSASPLTKKRRMVGRSVSLRSSNEEMMTPAA